MVSQKKASAQMDFRWSGYFTWVEETIRDVLAFTEDKIAFKDSKLTGWPTTCAGLEFQIFQLFTIRLINKSPLHDINLLSYHTRRRKDKFDNF